MTIIQALLESGRTLAMMIVITDISITDQLHASNQPSYCRKTPGTASLLFILHYLTKTATYCLDPAFGRRPPGTQARCFRLHLSCVTAGSTQSTSKPQRTPLPLPPPTQPNHNLDASEACCGLIRMVSSAFDHLLASLVPGIRSVQCRPVDLTLLRMVVASR